MGLDRKTLEQLEKDAARFVTKNHQSYLAQALECIRETGNPVLALQLLEKMGHSSFGDREEQKGALNHVGTWLENRLSNEPTVAAERLALEVGWLRRLSVVAETVATPEQMREVRARRIVFGQSIPQIEKRRALKGR